MMMLKLESDEDWKLGKDQKKIVDFEEESIKDRLAKPSRACEKSMFSA